MKIKIMNRDVISTYYGKMRKINTNYQFFIEDPNYFETQVGKGEACYVLSAKEKVNYKEF